MKKIKTQVLIVGAGGSGLALSIFLGDLGIDALTVERHPATSHLPKAHYVSQRTMEIFRQHGFADAVYAQGARPENLQRVRWLTSVGGDGPLDRIKIVARPVFGGMEDRADYEGKGVTPPTNIPQVRLEPILLDVVESRYPGRVLFQHEFLSFEETGAQIIATIRNRETSEEFQIECDYLIAADGGKTIGNMVGVNMEGQTDLGEMYTIWFKADLSGLLDEDDVPMRRIWHPSDPYAMTSLLAFGPKNFDRHSEEWTSNFGRVWRKDDLGDDGKPVKRGLTEEEIIEEGLRKLKLDVPVEVIKVNSWTREQVIADKFSFGRVHLIGDAAHRHGAGAGLGLNSGFQDAHNIAWKLALVLKGSAPASLLNSFESERRPVVSWNAEWSTLTMSNLFLLSGAMGAVPGEPPEQTVKRFELLMSDTRMGATKRAQMHEIFATQRIEYAAHDIEMGFHYDDGAVVGDGTPAPWRDPMGHEYRPTSRPGSRLPHAWLHSEGERVSTHDLIPIGGFLLLTGIGGQEWCNAAAAVAAETNLTIRTIRVGEGGDASDPAGAWARVREIADDGCILVRPDAHVGFRAITRVDNPRADLKAAIERLLAVKG